MMKKVLKNIGVILLRLGISIALLIFLFKQVDIKNLVEMIKNTDKHFLALAGFIFFFNYVLCLFRWEMLLKRANLHLPLKRVIISMAGGLFFNLFLPSTIGGDLIRSIDLSMHTRRPKEVLATVLLDRLSGYIGLVVVALLALLFGWRFVREGSVLLSIGIITLILVVILFVLFNKFLYRQINQLLHSPTAGKIREYIKDVHEEMHIFRHHTDILVDNLLLSLAIQAIAPLTIYIIALSLGIKIKIIYFFVFIPIIMTITLLPISLGGLGLRDATTIFFFAKVGVSKDLAFAMSLLSFFFILLYGMLGGLIYVLTVHHRRIQHHQPRHVHPKHP